MSERRGSNQIMKYINLQKFRTVKFRTLKISDGNIFGPGICPKILPSEIFVD